MDCCVSVVLRLARHGAEATREVDWWDRTRAENITMTITTHSILESDVQQQPKWSTRSLRSTDEVLRLSNGDKWKQHTGQGLNADGSTSSERTDRQVASPASEVRPQRRHG